MNSSAASPSPRAKSALRRRRRGFAGFTLVEMLVAVTALTMIAGLLSQLVGAATKTSEVCQRRINNFTKARALLDLMAQDLAAGLFRSDLAFYPAGSQTELAFYTQRPGVSSSASRDLALVAYAIDATSSESTLQRSDLSIGWSSQASDVSFGNAAVLTKLANVKPSDTAGGVVGLQVRFLLADGTVQTAYANTDDNPLRAIGVTLAVVDDQNMARMDGARLARLRQQLASAAPATSSVKEAWEKSLDAGFDWSPYPKTLRGGLLVFERFVYVSPSF